MVEILVVDEQLVVYEGIKEIVKQTRNHDTLLDWAEDQNKAISMLKNKKYDLIFLEIFNQEKNISLKIFP